MKRRRDRAEIQLSPLSFPTWRGRPKGPPPPPPPPLSRFRAKWTECTHRDKWCSLQSISGKAETTSTSVTRVRHQQHPGGRPARPASGLPSGQYLWVPLYIFSTVSVKNRALHQVGVSFYLFSIWKEKVGKTSSSEL